MKKLFLTLSLLLSAGITWAEGIRMLNNTTAQVDLPNGQQLYIDFYSENIFRIFQDPHGGIIRDPEANPPARILVDNPRRFVIIRVDDASGTVSSRRVQVHVNKQTGQISVKQNGHTVFSQTAPVEFAKNRTTISLSQGEKDYFYGGGCQNGRFSHRGETIQILNTNNWVDGGVSSPCPFFWSTAGYGVMGYTFAPGRYDFGSTDASKTILSHETDRLDYFVMVDEGAVPLLNHYYQLTGNPILLPKFGFYEGHLNAYNRDYWKRAEDGKQGGGYMTFPEDKSTYQESQKDNGGIKESLNGEKNNYQFSARAAIDRYIMNDMPLGWFLPNDGYGCGYGQTGTLEGNIQNLKEFGDYARSKGVELGLWTQSDLYPKEGVEPLLQRDIIKEVRDAGVRVLKTDVAWVGAGYSFGLNGVADVAQIMPYYGGSARPFIISCDGWAGTQRYAGIWTGDQAGGEWEYIRYHIPSYIGSGLSGQPNITSDTDGIFGGQNMRVNIRDFQWKAFTPMQMNMDGWGSHPKYPQGLGEPATSINRWYLKIKSMLMPYTYSIAHEAVNGKPMMRAMFLEEENEYTLGRGTQYQFMYGPSILVAPVYQETRPDSLGNDQRDGIYLPEGHWYHGITGEHYLGGRIINNFEAPLWKLPFFYKGGSIIPVAQAHNNPGERLAGERCYDIIPQGRSQFTEYDDDGVSTSYQDGEFATTHIVCDQNKDHVLLTIEPTKGGYVGFAPQKRTIITMRTDHQPDKITLRINGQKQNLKQVDDRRGAGRTSKSCWYFEAEGHNQNLYATAEKPFANTVVQSAPYLVLQVAPIDVTDNTIEIEIDGFDLPQPNDPYIRSTGTIHAPHAAVEGVRADMVTLRWDAMEHADYYEVEFQGQLYSTIRQLTYAIDGLKPLTKYQFRVRGVNADGHGAWTTVTATTPDDPLRDAIRGMKGETSCPNQGGQDVSHLFDFDLGSTWHTEWQKKAVPFDITIDMKSLNQLDKLQYVPRPDAANGTILAGTLQVSTDRQKWTDVGAFECARDASVKEIAFNDHKTLYRYVRLYVTRAVGDFGSGQQIYIFRMPGSEYTVPGDINQDGHVDENDLTGYLNYTGLRQGDGDFAGYISRVDLNHNGLIDAYDISAMAIELEGGVSSRKVSPVSGQITLRAAKTDYAAGEEVRIDVVGQKLASVNAFSFALPYDAAQLQYLGVETTGTKKMYNMTNDRLHSNGQKALYPTFVNLGEQETLSGNGTLLTIRFRARTAYHLTLGAADGMLVDKYLNVVKF